MYVAYTPKLQKGLPVPAGTSLVGSNKEFSWLLGGSFASAAFAAQRRLQDAEAIPYHAANRRETIPAVFYACQPGECAARQRNAAGVRGLCIWR